MCPILDKKDDSANSVPTSTSLKESEKDEKTQKEPKQTIKPTVAFHDKNFKAEQVEDQFLVSLAGSKIISLMSEFTIKNVKYVPMPKERYPYEPYLVPKNLSKPSIRELADKILQEFNVFVDASLEYKYAWTADVIFSYVQNHKEVQTTHYDQIIGGVDSGKTRVLELFNYLAYRPLLSPSLPVADIYNYLGTNCIGCILEDQAEDIEKDREKMKIYKSGYRKGAVVPRMKEDGEIQKFYGSYGFKAFASENEIKERGFTDRCVLDKMVSGYPKYDEITEEDKERWQQIKSEGLLWSLFAVNEPLPKLNLPFKGRIKELIGPTLRVVSSLPVIYNSIENRWKQIVATKENLLKTSLEAKVTKIVINLFAQFNGKPISYTKIWDNSQKELGVKENEEGKIVFENGEVVTKMRIAGILKNQLAGEKTIIHTSHSTTSAYNFQKEQLKRLGKKYYLNTEILEQPSLETQIQLEFQS